MQLEVVVFPIMSRMISSDGQDVFEEVRCGLRLCWLLSEPDFFRRMLSVTICAWSCLRCMMA